MVFHLSWNRLMIASWFVGCLKTSSLLVSIPELLLSFTSLVNKFERVSQSTEIFGATKFSQKLELRALNFGVNKTN